MHNNNGFSLMELLIAVAIIGILAGIAYPNYLSYVTQTRRTDGIAKLIEVMQYEERYFTENLRYTTVFTDLGYANADLTAGKLTSAGGFYEIAAAACPGVTTSCIQLTATPQGAQADQDSTPLTLDSRGNRTGNWNN